MSREVLHIDKNKLFVVAKAIPLGTHPCTVHAPQEEQLVEVSRNLLMLGDQPNAQQWKAREQAYRNRLLAVTLDGATKHHMYGMVCSTHNHIWMLRPTAHAKTLSYSHRAASCLPSMLLKPSGHPLKSSTTPHCH